MATNAPSPDQRFESKHLNLIELMNERRLENNKYLFKPNIPPYPANVEFNVSSIAHVTNESGLRGILTDGFRAGKKRGPFLWWGLHVSQSEIMEAQQRYLDREFPNMQAEDNLLSKFTTSPAFSPKSRYGNFRFTFRLADLMRMYQDQICERGEPILRVYETVVFKQEIMYVVVVHSPAETQFDRYPLLRDVEEGAVCAYKGGEIIWRAQAMSETHKNELTSNTDQVMATLAEGRPEFYVWDHVALAFHIPPHKTLVVEREKLMDSLSACEMTDPVYDYRLKLDLNTTMQIVKDVKTSKN